MSKISGIFGEKETLRSRHRCCAFSTIECAIFSKKIANFRRRAAYENYKGIEFSINTVEYRLSEKIADFLVCSSVFSYRQAFYLSFFFFKESQIFKERRRSIKFTKESRFFQSRYVFYLLRKNVEFQKNKIKVCNYISSQGFDIEEFRAVAIGSIGFLIAPGRFLITVTVQRINYTGAPSIEHATY